MSKEKHVLNVMERTNIGSAASRKARREGKVPAIVYGHGADPQKLMLDAKEWDIISKQDIQIVKLKCEGGKTLNAFIKEVQYNYLAGKTTHIDFLEVKMDEAITASVPIHAHGTPIGLSQGGVLDQIMHDIEVNCTPLTLPDSITVDVAELELESSILVGDLVFPDGVIPIPEADQTVLNVMLPRIQEEEEEEEEEGVEGEEGAEGAEGAEAGEEAKESE
jgi:large subunit ribosomal protein L25